MWFGRGIRTRRVRCRIDYINSRNREGRRYVEDSFVRGIQRRSISVYERVEDWG